MRHSLALAALAITFTLASAGVARADGFRSVADCVRGRRVVTSDGHRGTITRIDRAWSYCYVHQDDTGREVSYLYSLLRGEGPGGAAVETVDKLVPGVYECFADGHYTFMDMRITGANTYSAGGHSGRFHVESSGKIVFESGPFVSYHGKLFNGPRIGLNTNGDSFYATTCELNRSRK